MYDDSEIFNQTNPEALKFSPGLGLDRWLFYLQVYPWITASGLSQFMATYGNHKNVTCFIPLLDKNDGGARSLRFFKGDSSHRGYTINVKYLPAQLVRRLFTLVCI